jgi:small-conductance mechanosensitive channel
LLVSFLRKLAKRTTTDFDDFFADLIAQIGLPTFIAISIYFAALPLHLDANFRLGIRYLLIIALTIRSILLLQAIAKYGVVKFYKHARPDDPFAEHVIKNMVNVFKWIFWVLGIVFVLGNLGINISALMAGIGIGGVAVALASQVVLGDMFSAISIFFDKPFEVGDFIIVDDYTGTVEYVGIKTTRIRSLGGEQLVLSNSDLTRSRIKNYKRMQVRRIVFKIGVIYETSVEKVKLIPQLVKNIFAKIDGVRLDRVHFSAFGDFSLVYEIVYFTLSADYNVYMDKQQEINFSMKEVFEKEKIEFAYPTQKLFVLPEK